MPDISQLPHLIKLLEDDSPVVRDAVVQELRAFGPELRTQVTALQIELTDGQRRLLESLVTDEAQVWLRESWPSWFTAPSDKDKLERALSLISAFRNGPKTQAEVTALLDALCAEYREHYPDGDPEALADFLFRSKGLTGARDDYYDPANSDLSYVVREGRGIPISLACIFMLVGKRLGLSIEGCNFPGHFLAMTIENGEARLVDCFDGGRFLTDTDLFGLARLHGVPERVVDHMLETPTPAEHIVMRVLNNLTVAYHHVGEPRREELMQELLAMVKQHTTGPAAPNG